MLEDDVTSNKAIGSYGADFLYQRGDDSKKLSVLTHCNTGRYMYKHPHWLKHTFILLGDEGNFLHLKKNQEFVQLSSDCDTIYIVSLATAGFGTALGVIRALYTEGVLERAYCTETRPFNQVSIPYIVSLFF